MPRSPEAGEPRSSDRLQASGTNAGTTIGLSVGPLLHALLQSHQHVLHTAARDLDRSASCRSRELAVVSPLHNVGNA
ncbi:unnamed protein product [Parajaminaea phylloscopi]